MIHAFVLNNNRKLFDGTIALTAYYNGYFYYIEGGRTLLRVKEDGTQQSTVLTLPYNQHLVDVKILGNWIYYTVRQFDSGMPSYAQYSGHLYRESFDGRKEELTQVKTGLFYVFKDGYCYQAFENTEEGILAKWEFRYF